MISNQILDDYGAALFHSISSRKSEVRKKNLEIIRGLEETHPSIQTEYKDYIKESQLMVEGAGRKGKEK